MTRSRKIRIRIAALALGLAGLLIPVTLAPGTTEAVEANEACASGACCREAGSVCEVDDEPLLNYYRGHSCQLPT